jgi:hypothetical protein
VIANNDIRLREIQTQIVEDQVVFQGIDSISISTMEQIVQKKHKDKAAVSCALERNSNRVKEQ